MSLNDLRRGQVVKVVHIPDDTVRVQLLRFGITPGSQVRCHTKVPFGPVVVKYGGQEIAVGRQVARGIRVESVVGGGAARGAVA
ncbi:MAG: ferrous iron transport protein A [Deferrisomatales bacterium]